MIVVDGSVQADVIIGTFCMARDHLLLHNDRGFEPMAAHLGLQLA